MPAILGSRAIRRVAVQASRRAAPAIAARARMMLVMTDLPDALADLADSLTAAGFHVDSSERSAAFGNRVVDFARGPLRARFVSDRGQWFVELRRDTWDDWFDPDIWRACLDDVPVARDPRVLDEQAAYVAAAIERIGEAVAHRFSAHRLRSCLERQRSTRSRRRLGLDDG